MANPTDKQKLDAAWDRLKVWNNVTMPSLYARLVKLAQKLS
ncbi:MAG TPA: hypothetical protein VMD08_03855 [Candidatus Baltobacteraceae bacterium]|nr:hypothetical protein [Candidatus Baltobacteraceae bacterium]